MDVGFAPGSRQRNIRLESYLARALTPSGRRGPYEPSVVSGPDPARGVGPTPYFAYLVLRSDAVLAARWPTTVKALEVLARFEDVIEVTAAADVAPAFLVTPYKERAQHVRILFWDQLQEAQVAINVYLLNTPVTEFPKLLRRLWIQQLIGCTLRSSSVRSHPENRGSSSGLWHYDWLLRAIVRYGSERKWVLTCSCRAATWAESEEDFCRAFWRDSRMLQWFLEQLAHWSLTGDYRAALCLLKGLAAILDAADSATSWAMLEPFLPLLSDTVVRLTTIDNVDYGIGCCEVCAHVCHSILDLPTLPDQIPSPATALVSVILLNPEWEACVVQLLRVEFDLMATEDIFEPRSVIALFETFDVIQRLVSANNSKPIVDIIVLHFYEEFRYFASTEKVGRKFPEHCPLKESVLSAIDGLKSVILKGA